MAVEYFNGKEMTKRINPDEAVAQGAAIQAAIIASNESHDIEIPQELKNYELEDVIPMTLGIRIAGGKMDPIISRNTRIPV